MTLNVYFADKGQLAAGANCDAVFAVERTVPRTLGVARAALTELLEGPTTEESLQGYGTAIPSGVQLADVEIVPGTSRAQVSFGTDILGVSDTDCHVEAARAQIVETVRQFPTVTSVSIIVDGQDQNLFQPGDDV